jgi:hypothetical protein
MSKVVEGEQELKGLSEKEGACCSNRTRGLEQGQVIWRSEKRRTGDGGISSSDEVAEHLPRKTDFISNGLRR